MGAVARGLRNLGRNRGRSLLVALLMGMSVTIAISAAAAADATERRAQELRRDVATLIQVNPAGVAPGGGSGAGLPQSLGSRLATVEGVVGVEAYLRRQFVDNTQQVSTGVLSGVEPGSELRLSAMGGFTGTPRLIAGRALRPEDRGAPVAVVGQVFARQHDLRVGSTFTLPAEQLKGTGGADPAGRDLRAEVVGIFGVDVAYGDNQLFVPLSVAQQAAGTADEVTQFWVAAADVGQVTTVQQRIGELLGEQVDLLTQAEQAERAAASLAAVGANSLLTAWVAAGVGGVIVLLTMALVTRERRREIGVLKALGAHDRTVAAQFVAESVALAVAGGAVAAVLVLTAGGLVVDVLGGDAGSIGSYQVPLGMVGGGVGLAAALGALGSLYPVFRSLRLRPAEAIRAGR